METEDRPAPPPPAPGGTSRRAAVAAIAAALLLVVAVVAVFATRGGGDAAGSTAPEPPPSQTTTAAATTTTIDTETEVVARLREILRVRDRAFHERNAELLPRRNLDSGLAGWRLSRSGVVRISSYFRSL
jgi:hypothetical protein